MITLLSSCLYCLLWHNTLFLFQRYYSCVRELDTANGFKHTYTAGPWVFTFPQQWKDWCRIIHCWLTGIHNEITLDMQNRLQDGKSWVGFPCPVSMWDKKETNPFHRRFVSKNFRRSWKRFTEQSTNGLAVVVLSNSWASHHQKWPMCAKASK